MLDVILSLLILFLSYPVLHPSSSCANGYLHCRLLTLDHTQVPGNLTNFPVVVAGTLGSSRIQNASCFDVIFSTDQAGATKIPWEMESCNQSTGAIVAHVLVASLSSSANNTFYVQYDNASISTPLNTGANAPTAVWDANFAGVWHLPNGATLTGGDSTTDANACTLVNAPTAGSGEIDGAGVFATSSSQSLNCGNGPSVQITGAMTIEAWVKWAAGGGSQMMIATKDKDTGGRAYTFAMNSSNTGTFYLNGGGGGTNEIDGSTSINTGAWFYVVGTFTASGTTDLNLYVNGVSDATPTGNLTTIPTATANFTIGAREYSGFQNYWNGSLDEVRLSNVARSANWITTTFNNQKPGSTFVTISGEL